jgi:hypothetical protein
MHGLLLRKWRRRVIKKVKDKMTREQDLEAKLREVVEIWGRKDEPRAAAMNQVVAEIKQLLYPTPARGVLADLSEAQAMGRGR